MIQKFKVQNSAFSINFSKFGIFSGIIVCAIVCFSCSVPNLEKPECIEARETIKQFYSNHFGGDLKPSETSLEKIKNSLTENLYSEIKKGNDGERDYFTQTSDYPKAFRVGGCEANSPNKTTFEILLFWKDETRNEQREINVEAVKNNDRWLIDKVENKK